MILATSLRLVPLFVFMSVLLYPGTTSSQSTKRPARYSVAAYWHPWNVTGTVALTTNLAISVARLNERVYTFKVDKVSDLGKALDRVLQRSVGQSDEQCLPTGGDVRLVFIVRSSSRADTIAYSSFLKCMQVNQRSTAADHDLLLRLAMLLPYRIAVDVINDPRLKRD